MAISNKKNITWTLEAAEDMSDRRAGIGAVHKAVSNVDGTIANTTKPGAAKSAIGLIQYDGWEEEHITFASMGILKFTAAAAISSADVLLTVTTSGYMAEASSGDYYTGRFLEGTNGAKSCSSGSVATGMFNFATPVRLEE